jgi:hypothetical protein
MWHDWALSLDNKVDEDYFIYESHNGPFCTKCRKFFCVKCDDISNLICESNELEWSPIGGELATSVINRKGHDE